MENIKKINYWLESINLLNYEYIIIIDKSINNYRKIYESENESKILMPDGFLLEIPKIAESYVKNKKLPNILLLDTLIIHGLHNNKFLNELEYSLIKAIQMLDSHITKEEIIKKIIESIHISTYALTDNTILLKNDYKTKLQINNCLNINSSRELLDKINKEIDNLDIATTNEVLSAVTEETSKKESILYDIEENDSDILYNLKKQNIFPLIYSYVRNNKRFFTPYLFINETELNTLIKALIILFQDKNLKQSDFIKLLNDVNELDNLNIYSKIVNLILSQIYLKKFTLDMNIKVLYNIGDVCPNYGLRNKIEYLLKEYSNVTISDETFDDVNTFLNKNCSFFINHNESLLTPKTIVKRNIYEKGLNREEEIDSRINSLYSNYKYIESIKSFIESDKINDKNILNCLLYLLQYSKSGTCKIDTKSKILNREAIFYKYIEPNDFTLSIIPKELKDFESYTNLIIELYWKEDDMPKRMEEYLKNFGIEDSYIENAVYYSENICRHRKIANSITNWKTL